MGEAAERVRMTAEEYLAFERASEIKHEFADGEVFAMSGGTRAHSLIGSNLVAALGTALAARPCEVHGSDMRIKVSASGRYTYADVVVVCGEPRFEDATEDTLLNPRVVIEVLSDSTEGYDRGDKFAQYRSIESLAEYVLVSQHRMQIEVYRRGEGGAWIYRALGPGERLELASVGCSIEVERAYLKVFDRPAAGAEG